MWAATCVLFWRLQRRHEAALAGLRAKEESLLRLGGMGSWERPPGGGPLIWSDEHFRLYGVIPGAFTPTLDAWLSRVHSDDRRALAEALEQAGRDGRSFSVELRVPKLSGETSVLLVTGAGRRGAGPPWPLWGVSRDITEEKVAAAHSKSVLHREFVANVSHEFRTPLAAIRGFAESLRESALNDPATALEFVRIIEKHAERLSVLIESLLDVSALECGRQPAKPESVALSPFLWSLADHLSPLASKRRIRMRLSVPAELRVWVDREHLSHALQSLCDNAIKYNREGGAIDIEAQGDDSEVRILVRDTGIGILPEDVPHVFDRFHQRKRSRARIGGGGVGLSIVKTVVESNGGRVQVAGTSPRGTVFQVVLPASRNS